MQVEYQGRPLNLPVDRAPGDYAFYLPANPRWDDGNSIPAEIVDLIKHAITELLHHCDAASNPDPSDKK